MAPLVKNEYDAVGNLSTTTDALGNETWFNYDSLNRLRKESQYDTLIADDSSALDDVAFSIINGTRYQIDGVGAYGSDMRMVSGTNPQVTWAFSNLEPGNYRVSISSAMLGSWYGAVVEIPGTTPLSKTIEQLKPSTDFTTIHHDRAIGWEIVGTVTVASAQTLTVLLKRNGESVLLPDAVRIDRIVSNDFEYDKTGQVTKSTDTRGNVTDYQYDELGRQIKVTLPDPDGVASLGRLETRTIYDGYGNRKETIENRGTPSLSTDDRTNTYAYDKRNRLTQVIVDEGTDRENITTKYSYDAVGNKTSEIDALVHETRYRYDALNRVIDIYEDYGNGAAAAQSLQLGTPSSSTGVAFANNNTQITLTGTTATWVPLSSTGQTYNVTHRTVLEFTVATQNLAAFQIIGIDSDASFSGAAETNHYFQLGGTLKTSVNTEFIQEIQPDGSVRIQIPIGEYLSSVEKYSQFPITRLAFLTAGAAGLNAADVPKTTFSNIKIYESDEIRTVTSYDTRGNIVSVEEKSDPRGIKTTFEYDRLGRQTAKILDAGGSQQRKYTTVFDAAGNVIVERSPAAGAAGFTAETRYQYDHLKRLIATTPPDPDGLWNTPNGLVTTFAYDAAGNVIRETNGEGETTHTFYDAEGRTISALDGNGDETRYRYDSEGNLTLIIDAEQNVTTFTYDGLNRQKTEKITALVGTTVQQLTRTNFYDNAGNLQQITDRNGRTRTFTYNTLDRRIAEAWSGVPGNVLTWQYDDLGRVTKETDNGTVNTYTFDGLGRLIEQTNYDRPRPAVARHPRSARPINTDSVIMHDLGGFHAMFCTAPIFTRQLATSPCRRL